MALVSNTGTLTISSLPAYVSSTIGTFTQIPTSNISYVDPGSAGNPSTPVVSPLYNGPASKINAWTSMCVDQRTGIVYSIQQGGHNDYAGNEVNRFQLLVPGARWEQIRAPSPNSGIPPLGRVRYYGDGAPCAHHTYYEQWFDESGGANGRVMQFGGAWFDPAQGGGSPQVDAFDIATNEYLLNGAGNYPDVPSAVYGGSNAAPGAAQDTRNGNIFIIGEYTVAKWTRGAPGSMAMLSITGSAPTGYGLACAFDSAQNRILMLGGSDSTYNTQHVVFYVDTNTYQSATLTGSAAASVMGGGNGLQYVPALNEFFLRKGAAGGTVYRIVPTGGNTFDCTTLATTGGSGIPGLASGPYNKWLYVSLLKSIVLFCSHTGNGWCLRIHN